MEAVVPLALVWVLCVSGAPNVTRRRHDDVTLDEEEDKHPQLYDDDERVNISEKGMYLGSPCEFTCNPELVHVHCDPVSASCRCDSKHPVVLGVSKGCAKPKKLGEQCFYRQTCEAFDVHATCVQVNHNAYCQCDPGYHSTTHSRPTQRVFCTEDLVLLTADMPTLLGVASGIFVLAGLLCMVLHLYTRARYHPTHLADARLTPPAYSHDTGDSIGGTLSATRASSRASSRSGATSGTLDEAPPRRGSRRGEGASAGVAVSASRAGAARAAAILLISRHLRPLPRRGSNGASQLGGAHPLKCAAKGSRRPSLTSMQSSSSSIRSYSSRMWEREREQKERRQMSMRLAQLHDKMAAGRDVPRHAPTPSPRSPNNSTDGLLPSVCEIRELLSKPDDKLQLQGVDGPCTSSSLY